MTDLRMGSEPDYIFRFNVAKLSHTNATPIDDKQLKTIVNWQRLGWVWKKSGPPNHTTSKSVYAAKENNADLCPREKNDSDSL